MGYVCRDEKNRLGIYAGMTRRVTRHLCAKIRVIGIVNTCIGTCIDVHM